MFHPLHSITNQDLFEKYLCNPRILKEREHLTDYINHKTYKICIHKLQLKPHTELQLKQKLATLVQINYKYNYERGLEKGKSVSHSAKSSIKVSYMHYLSIMRLKVVATNFSGLVWLKHTTPGSHTISNGMENLKSEG